MTRTEQALLDISAAVGNPPPGSMQVLRSWDDWRKWCGSSGKRDGLLVGSAIPVGDRLVAPPGRILHRRDPMASLDFRGQHDRLVMLGQVDVANVGTAPLWLNTVSCYGRIPYRSAAEIEADQAAGKVRMGLGGQPFYGVGGEGRMASVWGPMGGSPRWAGHWNDGRPFSDWFQAAVDSGERPGWQSDTRQGAKRIQGRLILGRNAILGSPRWTVTAPINLDMRWMEIYGYGTGRDNVVLGWDGTVPEGWPRTLCVFQGVTTRDELRGSAGFLRKLCNLTILGPDREDETRIGEETCLVEAYDRCDEFSMLSDLEIMRAGTNTFTLQAANGMRIEQIHWSVAGQISYEERDTDPAARAWCEAQTLLCVRGGTQWGQGTGGSGQLQVDGLWTNDDGATLIRVENNGHLAARNIDFEGARRVLAMNGNATHVSLRDLHGASRQRQYSDYDQGNQARALIEILSTTAKVSSSLVVENLTHANDYRKIYDHTAERLKAVAPVEDWLWSKEAYGKESDGIEYFSRSCGGSSMGYGMTNKGQTFLPIKEPVSGRYYRYNLRLT